MEYEAETENDQSISILELQRLPQNIWSPQEQSDSGSQTPPFLTEVAVPFRWEEEPGKPRPCTALVPLQAEPHELGKLLPPPRMLTEAILAKMPPLCADFPELEGISRTRHQSFSFRITREHHGSIHGSSTNMKGSISQRFQGGTRADVAPSRRTKLKENGWFVSWLRKVNLARGKREATMSNSSSSSSSNSSCVFPSSIDKESGHILSWSRQGTDNNSMTTMTRTTVAATGSPPLNMATVRREQSLAVLSPNTATHFWANTYEGLKKRSRKLKKMGS